MAASITADLSLDTSGFAAAFGRVRGIMSGAGSRLAALWPAVLAGGAAAFAGIAAGAVGVKKALDVGGELSDLSSQTGLAAGEAQVMQQAFKNNGMAAEDVGGSINKMQKAIAGGSDAFAKMGVNLDALKGQSPAEQFKTVGEAINGIADPAQRTAASMEVFGKSGAKLLTLFSDSGAMGQAAEEVGTQAEILSRNAGLFDSVGDKLNLAGLKTQGFFVGVADKVIPVLAPLLDKFVALDLAKYGQALGDGVAFLIQALADGQLATILFESARIGFANAANFLMRSLNGIGAALWASLSEAVKGAITLFEILTTADFWKGLGNALLAAGQSFLALLLDGMASLNEKLATLPGLGFLKEGAKEQRGMAADYRAKSEANSATASSQLAPALAKATDRMKKTLAEISAAFSKGFDSGEDAFDTSKWQKKLDEAVDKVMRNAEAAAETAQEAADGKPRTGTLADDEEKDGGQKKGTGPRIFADADRRMGLGGTAYASKSEVDAGSKMVAAKLDKTNGLLEKVLAKEPDRNAAPKAYQAVFAR